MCCAAQAPGDPLSRRATLYRRVGDDAWIAIAGLVTAGDTLTYTDTTAPAGLRSSYRLGILNAGHELIRGAIDVNLPGSVDLAGIQAWPNPAHGALSLAFALGEAAAVTVELYDVAGRRVLARSFGTMPPGVHTLELREATTLDEGIYFLRARKGASVTSKRVCLLR